MSKQTVQLISLLFCFLGSSLSCSEERNYFPFEGYYMPYYSSPTQNLSTYNTNIKTVVAVIHGADRNANDYYCYMQSAVNTYFGSNNYDTFVFAPNFNIKTDPQVGANVFYWDNANIWKDGKNSTENYPVRVSAYGILDIILQSLSDSFPSLTNVVVAGHSAGGQYVQRYALTSQFKSPKYAIRYLPANPSSFAYLDDKRVVQTIPKPDCSDYCVAEVILKEKFTFAVPDSSNCTNYDQWKYGIEPPYPYYMRDLTISEMISQYLPRHVTYLAGGNDTCNSYYECGCDDSGIDYDCEAMLQGRCRLQRSVSFYQYLNSFGKNTHNLEIVPGVGHDGNLMFNSQVGMNALFGGLN